MPLNARLQAIADRIAAVPALSTLAASPTPFNCGEIARLLNKAEPSDNTVPTRRVAVAASKALSTMLVNDSWPEVVLAADTHADAATRKAAIAVRDAVVRLPQLSTNMSAAYNKISAHLTTLVGSSVLTAGQRSQLLGLADEAQSWADSQGLEPVQAAEVKQAVAG